MINPHDKLDIFAAAALTGLLSATSSDYLGHVEPRWDAALTQDQQQAVDVAYEIAELMLAKSASIRLVGDEK